MLHSRLRALLTTGLLLLPAALRADTLLEIYDLAVKNDPVIKAAEATFLAGKEFEVQGRSQLLPQVGAQAEYNESDLQQTTKRTFPLNGQNFQSNTDYDLNDNSDNYYLTVSQNIFNKSVHALRCSTVLMDRANHRHPITASAAPINDSHGNAIGAIMVLRDVSESREMARRLSWQASHDALTGLFNRQEFEHRLAQMLEEAQRDNVRHALLYLDLDQFKLVNDTCGHMAGVELLRQLGYLLKLSLRDTDTLARLGGDEFGILLNHCHMLKANEIAENLRGVVREFRFVWQEKHFEIGASIGIVPIDQRSESSIALMSAADLACYAAKDRGRNRIHLYVPDDAELSRRHGEMEWVSRIRSALTQNRFLLYRQAIYSIQTGIPVEAHTEILVRMMAEDGCIIDPGQFIPAAERYDLMPQIDRPED